MRLLDYSGCAVVISHDRWHEGNFQSYVEDLKRRKGPDADQPHRVQYKALVRS